MNAVGSIEASATRLIAQNRVSLADLAPGDGSVWIVRAAAGRFYTIAFAGEGAAVCPCSAPGRFAHAVAAAHMHQAGIPAPAS